MPNGAINENIGIEPVGTLWKESYIAISEIDVTATHRSITNSDRITNLGIAIFIILFFLFAFNRLAQGISTVIRSVFNLGRLYAIENHIAVRSSRNTTVAFFTIIIAFYLSNNAEAPVWLFFSLFVGAALLYHILRKFVMRSLSWVNKSSIFKYVNGIFYTHIVLFIIFTFPIHLIFTLSGKSASEFIFYYTLSIALATAFLFFMRGYQVIISKGFSLSFCILYLCTLEILPIALIVHLIS